MNPPYLLEREESLPADFEPKNINRVGHCFLRHKKRTITLGGIRTPNPRFRRPMPYPLGHEGCLEYLSCGLLYKTVVSTENVAKSHLDMEWSTLHNSLTIIIFGVEVLLSLAGSELAGVCGLSLCKPPLRRTEPFACKDSNLQFLSE